MENRERHEVTNVRKSIARKLFAIYLWECQALRQYRCDNNTLKASQIDIDVQEEQGGLHGVLLWVLST